MGKMISPTEQQAVEKLENLVQDMSATLLRIRSVFPFDIIPTELIIEKTKVTVKNPLFWGADEIKTILIKEISHVEVVTSLWFATLKIVSTIPYAPHIMISHLWKKDAMEAHRIIQGLKIGLNEKVDLSEVPARELKKGAEQLGTIPAAV